MTQRSLIGLRAALERNGIKQNELARAIGVEAVTVWTWVNGDKVPRADNLMAVVAYLQQHERKITAADLFAEGGRA